MILPDNGKVVIFDDKINEVKELIAGLSSEKVPFVYFQDEAYADLPETPIENVRLVFLDLLLVNDADPPVKAVVSDVVTRLKKVISANNGPYILIYWSTKRRIYGTALEKELNKKNLSNWKPLAYLSLTKSSSNISSIKSELAVQFDKFLSLKPLLLIESITNRSIGNVVNDLAGLFKNNTTWNSDFQKLLNALCFARVGGSVHKHLDNNDKIKNALRVIASTVQESVEKRILESEFSEIEFSTITDTKTSRGTSASINTRLHTTLASTNNILQSGNIYLIDDHKTKKDRNKKIQFIKQQMDKIIKTDKARYFRPKLVCLDITPVCDYSQSKDYSRVLFGLLIRDHDKNLTSDFHKDHKAKQFVEISPLLNIDGQLYILFFDLRTCVNLSHEEFKKLYANPNSLKFKIGYELLNEIQSKVANQINRPGVITVDHT